MPEEQSRPDPDDLMRALNAGDADARDRVFEAIYADLRNVARRIMRRQRKDHTFQPTDLVHESIARLLRSPEAAWESRVHVQAVAAKAMRQVLVDHARRRGAAKRSAPGDRITLSAIQVTWERRAVDLLDLHDAVEALREVYPRAASVVHLRFFGDMGFEEIGTELGISARTAERDWSMANAWLYRRLR